MHSHVEDLSDAKRYSVKQNTHILISIQRIHTEQCNARTIIIKVHGQVNYASIKLLYYARKKEYSVVPFFLNSQ